MNSEIDIQEIESDPIRQESERETMEPEQEKQSLVEEDSVLKEMLRVNEEFIPLLKLLEQFSPGEDGIQLNRILRHFETTIYSMCPDETHLHKAFATFRAAALRNSVTARKLAVMGALFTNQQRLQPLRAALLNVAMQETFSKLDDLKRSNLMFLINAATMMGDYFSEARLCNGEKVTFLASPLMQYMRALLGSDDIRAHRCLATQLMQNGPDLLSVSAQELDELSISIRQRLLSPPPISTIWLLLSADLILHKFLPLPNTLQQFYAAQIEQTTEESFSEVDCIWIKNPEKADRRPSTNEIAEKVSANLSQIYLNSNEDAEPKQALSVSEDTFETCTTKDYLKSGHDLNSCRQPEKEKKKEIKYNQAVLPPNVQNVPVLDYPTPYNKQRNWTSQKAKHYLKKRHDLNTWREQGAEKNEDIEYNQVVLPPDVQTFSVPDYPNLKYNRQRNVSNRKSNDNVTKDDEKEKYKDSPRRHVTELPRNIKYWAHDDRCDKI